MWWSRRRRVVPAAAGRENRTERHEYYTARGRYHRYRTLAALLHCQHRRWSDAHTLQHAVLCSVVVQLCVDLSQRMSQTLLPACSALTWVSQLASASAAAAFTAALVTGAAAAAAAALRAARRAPPHMRAGGRIIIVRFCWWCPAFALVLSRTHRPKRTHESPGPRLGGAAPPLSLIHI